MKQDIHNMKHKAFRTVELTSPSNSIAGSAADGGAGTASASASKKTNEHTYKGPLILRTSSSMMAALFAAGGYVQVRRIGLELELDTIGYKCRESVQITILDVAAFWHHQHV